MQAVALTSLIDVPIAIIVSNKDTLPIRPGSHFQLPVVVITTGEQPLGWSQHNPLNLSYRWLTEEGELIDRDGLRSSIPVAQLIPGSRVEIEMVGKSPESEGCYRLQLSLVLEGVHWACDVGSSGWTERVTNVTPAPAWPEGLKQSLGGRALRGAMAATELARHFEKLRLAEQAASKRSATGDVAPDSVSASNGERKASHRGVGNWLRSVLGVRGLEHQLADLIALAGGQEQRSRELENQILTLKEELQAGQGRKRPGGGSVVDPRFDGSVPFALPESAPTTADAPQRTGHRSKRLPKRKTIGSTVR